MHSMTKALSRLTLAVALLLTCAASQAELVWKHKEVTLAATPLEKEVSATYPFTNEGKEPVKFRSFKSGCSCVTVTSTTMEVPPGGAGEVTVTFKPEFRIGSQKRPVAVQLDDPAQTRMALYLTVNIPEIVRPEPIFLRWGPEEALEPKAVTIVTDEQYPVNDLSVRPINPLWEAKVARIENSRNYSLRIQPKRGQNPQSQYVEVEAKLADGQLKRAKIYVVVK